MFRESLIEYKEIALNEKWNPAYAPIDVHNRIREVSSEKFQKELYGDLMEF